MKTNPLILIVDDNPKNLQVLGSMLKENNFNIAMTRDGFQALDFVTKNIPDIILLDMMMPEIDGLETCRKLKGTQESKNIPVIFITALTDDQNKLSAFEAGGVDYITKPFLKEEVLARINVHLTLKFQNEELRRSNEELQEMAQLIAHDLKSPLSVINGILQILEKDAEGKLSEPSLYFIQNAKELSLRMDRMIVDLLNYARLGKGHQSPKIMINKAVQHAIQNLDTMIQARKASIVVAELPLIYVEESPSIRLLQNLIHNGIKFNNSNIPTIHISCTEKENSWMFSVKDNGIGIDSNHLPKLFHMFHRFHDQKTYHGNGIGLAACKKIVEEILDGKIWMESLLNEGTIFFFTVPKFKLG